MCKMLLQITDDKGAPLSAVLLSLSGEKQYRSNNLTHEDGIMIFIGLVSIETCSGNTGLNACVKSFVPD
ncbi:hypothetical protein DPMN_079091 [Dreissena polymorpha]|uniref:Uncharacterized protein n=1 Tax=Dreissena polymorpha TaxID=45954 RepID=A0A9D3YT44_DREPO|nr:hypothetical protein DPMN_079091 [Dreissena polymorpha]